MVPFYSWQKSHRLHHMYHNHYEKDKSHKWYHKDEFFGYFGQAGSYLLRLPVLPLFVFFFGYLLAGIDDGRYDDTNRLETPLSDPIYLSSHYWPFSKLFSNTKERIQCAVSSLSCVGFIAATLHFYFSYDMTSFLIVYFGPFCIYNYWLFMVTYMQHHDHDSKVFDDTDFSYVRGEI